MKPLQLGREREAYDEIKHADVPCESSWGRQHCITCVCNLKRAEPKRELHETGCARESTGSVIGNVFMHPLLETQACWFEMEN